MTQRWKARFYDGESARETPIEVELTPQGLAISRDGERDLWPYAEITMEQGYYAGEVVRLDRAGQIVVVPDRAFLEQAKHFAPQFAPRTADPKMGRSIAALVLAATAVLTLIVVGLVLARPAIESAAADLVPVSFEERLGAMAYSEYAPRQTVCTDAELQREVEKVLERLVRASGQDRYTFQIRIVDNRAVNALAAPAGHLVVFSGLLKITDSPDELAGVLAHEVQHVLQRHTTKSIVRSAGVAALLSILTGDISGVLHIAGQLGSLSFARGDEEEADRKGMELLQQARLDPKAMVRVYEKLQREGTDMPGALRYLSTHPNTGDRVRILGELAKRANYQPVASEGRERWGALRGRCRSK